MEKEVLSGVRPVLIYFQARGQMEGRAAFPTNVCKSRATFAYADIYLLT